MSLDPVNKDVQITPAELPQIDFELSDSTKEKLEKEASLFAKKFVPANDDKTVRLVEVAKDGKKIIYEDNGQMHLAPSQTELAEEFINSGEDKAKFSEIFGGFFGRSKSMFNNKKDDNLI